MDSKVVRSNLHKLSMLLQLIILGLVTSGCRSAPAVSGHQSCQHRSTSELHAMWAEYHTHNTTRLHESFYLLPGMRPPRINDALSQSREYFSTVLYGDASSCQPSTSALDPIQKRSLCPWYNVITNDPDRYPTDLVEARSGCTQCLGGEGNCEGVWYPIPVLRRTNDCDNGYYVYTAGWHRLLVGYTCVVVPSH